MKSFILKLFLLLLFLATFNALFYLFVGFNCENISIWVSYGYIHFAYLMLLFAIFCKTKGEAGFFLTLTSILPAWQYFLIELLAGIIFIVLALEDYFWPTLVQTVIAFIFVAITVINMLANEVTANSLQKRSDDVKPFKNIVAELRTAQTITSNQKLKSILTECYTVLSTGSIRQTEASREIDENISLLIGLIKQNAAHSPEHVLDSAKRLLSLLKERKNLMKYSH